MLVRLASAIVILLGITVHASSIKKFKVPEATEALKLSVIPWDIDMYEFDLMFDLSNSSLKGKLIEREEGYTGEENRIIAECELKQKLKATQVKKIKSLLSKTIYCKQNGDPETISEYLYKEALVAYKKKPSVQYPEGKGLYIDKHFDESNETSRYLCEGHEDLYSYLEELTDEAAPATCPASYKMMFEF